jgi:hypothetical protein
MKETFWKKHFTGKFGREGWPMKAVNLVHGSVCINLGPGEHKLSVTSTGKDPNHMKHTHVKGTFAQCVRKAKKLAMKMGNHTTLWIHGASENTQDWQVRDGRLVRVF